MEKAARGGAHVSRGIDVRTGTHLVRRAGQRPST
jgi:hypothetical protein